MAAFSTSCRAARIASCAALVCALPLAQAHAQQGSPVALEGADQPTLKAIAALLPARDKPQTLFDAESLADEAAAIAENWMRSEGYYAGVAQSIGEEEPPQARVKLTLGKRFVLAAPDLEFTAPAPAVDAVDAARDALAPAGAGRPARAADVLAAEAGAVAALQARGYAEAKADHRTAIVDHATGEMRVTFRLAAGPPTRLGVLKIEPPGALNAKFAARLARWRPGDRYTPEALNDLRRDLASTGAFARVVVTLAAPDEAGLRDVLVHVEPTKPHTIEFGASYSTNEGFGGEGSWTKRNVTRRGDELTLSTTMAELEQKFSVSLLRPHEAGRLRAIRYTVEASHEHNAAYDKTGGLISASVEADPSLRRAILYGASLSTENFSQSTGITNANIVSAFLSGHWDYADQKFDPRRGQQFDARVEPAVAVGSATTVFVRLTGGARAYWSPYERLTLAARINAGWVQPVAGNDSDLPLDRRFYAGGGGSVRGYEYKSIYPATTTTAEPPGGKGLLETSAEARFRFGDRLGAAAFIDGGNAFNEWGDAGDLKWGAGVGVRYNLGFAPLRIDVAAPLNKRPGDAAVAFYVSLGQAF
jgi:translocation and assembly module TamA